MHQTTEQIHFGLPLEDMDAETFLRHYTKLMKLHFDLTDEMERVHNEIDRRTRESPDPLD